MDRHSNFSAAEVPAAVRAYSDWRRKPHAFVDTVFCEIYHSAEFLFDMNVRISYNILLYYSMEERGMIPVAYRKALPVSGHCNVIRQEMPQL
jgi:hypothetical protein